jgi:uncharacterized membrane protein
LKSAARHIPGGLFFRPEPAATVCRQGALQGKTRGRSRKIVDFKSHLETAWELTLEFIAPLILVTLTMFAVWLLSLGILMPVTLAGYTQALLRLLREGRDPTVRDLFSEMRLFWPLLGFCLAALALAVVGFFLLVVPGVLISIGFAFACLFVLPLMTDCRLSLTEAVKTSIAMGPKGDLVGHLVTVLIYLGILAVGSSVFVGSLFTQPLATLFLVSVFNQRRPE